jgi:hypothetical protein
LAFDWPKHLAAQRLLATCLRCDPHALLFDQQFSFCFALSGISLDKLCAPEECDVVGTPAAHAEPETCNINDLSSPKTPS